MRSPALALTWEIWGANRRGFLFLFGGLAAAGMSLHVLARAFPASESVRDLGFLPLVLSVLLLMALFNFTERRRRQGFAGFPERLFALPVRTGVLVTCPMACGVVCVVTLYLAWALLVLRPLGAEVLLGWPAMLLAAGMVFYQAIVWCLSGFRLCRLVVLALAQCSLVTLGCIPSMVDADLRRAVHWSLTTAVVVLVSAAYGAAFTAVRLQRHGSGRGWQAVGQCIQRLVDHLPHRSRPFVSPGQALFWYECRRSAWVLPCGVLLTVLLIMAAVTGFAGRDAETTARAAAWLVLSPFALAAAVGKGFAKPDFWSLDLALTSFWTTRPVTSAQLLAAKLKTAALGTVMAWAVLLVLALPWLLLACDTRDLHGIWQTVTTIYASVARWIILGLLLVAAMFLTWSLLIGSLWSGLYGRPQFFAGTMGLGTVCIIAVIIWWLLMVDDAMGLLVDELPWLPWLLAVAFLLKSWAALWAWRQAYGRGLASGAFLGSYLGAWLGATGCLVVLAICLLPRIEWLRQTLILTALLVCPLARIGLAVLSLACNRHR
jgi:hypothetical protein